MESKVNARKINLIPVEMAVPARAIKIAVVIRKISTILLILFIFLILTVSGVIYYYSNESNKVIQSISSLKTKVSNLQANEQKFVLAKDRLAKIAVVQNAKSVENEISRFKKFSEILQLSSDSNLSEANLSSKGSEVTVISKDSSALSLILKPLTNLTIYKNIIITSLVYNLGTGYLTTISLENN